MNSARWLPYLVVGVVVGALVDRHARRPIMITTDLVQALLLAAIPLLWWMDRLSFPTLLGIVMAYGTAAVVRAAAAMSFLPAWRSADTLNVRTRAAMPPTLPP